MKFSSIVFLKTKILSHSRNIARLFYLRKNEIISQYSSIDKNYIKKILDLKNPKENFKDLFSFIKFLMKYLLLIKKSSL